MTDLLLQRLSRIRSKAPTVVSCYASLTLNERTGQRYLVSLRQQAAAVTERLTAERLAPKDADRVRRDLERVLTWIARPSNLPKTGGVAIFASEAHRLFETVPLLRAIRTKLDADRFPVLHDLIEVGDLLGRYLAVLLDRTHARFFAVTATGAEELNSLVVPSTRGGRFHGSRGDSPGAGERDYHTRIEEEKHRHYAAVALAITSHFHSRPFAGLVVTGAAEAVRDLPPFLTHDLQAQLLGTSRLNPTSATPAEVFRAVWALEHEHDQTEKARLVDQLTDQVGRGWAVRGTRDTLASLARGQVRALLVPPGEVGSGFRCEGSGRLVLTKRECRGEPAEPVVDLLDQVIEEALRQRVEVVPITNPEQAERLEGLAATLRFRR